MEGANLSGQGREPRRGLSFKDRALAWLVTGRPGRLGAFALDFGAALGRGLRSALRRRR
jgi:hypothetical protein